MLLREALKFSAVFSKTVLKSVVGVTFGIIFHSLQTLLSKRVGVAVPLIEACSIQLNVALDLAFLVTLLRKGSSFPFEW